MYINVDFKLSDEIQKEIKDEAIKQAEEMLTRDKTELIRLIRECVKSVLKVNINDILQKDSFREFLKNKVLEEIGIIQKKQKVCKYEELRLTGDIPIHPDYLYEYELPSDFEAVVELIPYVRVGTNANDKHEVYSKPSGQLVLACNNTPIVLKYYAKEK